MTFESSINGLNYFEIVLLIYTDAVLITAAQIKTLGGAADVELKRAVSSRGPADHPAAAGRGMTPPLMNRQHVQT